MLPLPLLALVGWQCAFNLQFQDARSQREEPTQVRHVRAAIQTARQLLAERSACDLVVVSEGHSVEQASLAKRAPLSLSGGGAHLKVLHPISSNELEIKYTVIEPEYFRTLGIRHR